MNNEIIEIDDEKVKINVDGEIKEYDVLFSYDSPDADETYKAYTTGNDEEGNLIIHFLKASLLTKEQYVPVEDPEELKMLEKVLQTLMEKYQN